MPRRGGRALINERKRGAAALASIALASGGLVGIAGIAQADEPTADATATTTATTTTAPAAEPDASTDSETTQSGEEADVENSDVDADGTATGSTLSDDTDQATDVPTTDGVSPTTPDVSAGPSEPVADVAPSLKTDEADAPESSASSNGESPSDIGTYTLSGSSQDVAELVKNGSEHIGIADDGSWSVVDSGEDFSESSWSMHAVCEDGVDSCGFRIATITGHVSDRVASELSPSAVRARDDNGTLLGESVIDPSSDTWTWSAPASLTAVTKVYFYYVRDDGFEMESSFYWADFGNATGTVAPDSSTSIGGIVTLPGGAVPPGGIEISAVASDGKTLIANYDSTTGAYSFSEVPAGQTKIRVESAEGGRDDNHGEYLSETVVAVDGENVTKNLTLPAIGYVWGSLSVPSTATDVSYSLINTATGEDYTSKALFSVENNVWVVPENLNFAIPAGSYTVKTTATDPATGRVYVSSADFALRPLELLSNIDLNLTFSDTPAPEPSPAPDNGGDEAPDADTTPAENGDGGTDGAAEAAADTDELAHTGSDAPGALAAGVLLAAAGAGAVALSRRKNSAIK